MHITPGDKIFSNLEELAIVKYISKTLHKIAKIILNSEYCERRDIIVVKAPAPAINVKTFGVKVASLDEYLL